MAIKRLPLVCLLVAHMLLVWGGIGILGEAWLRALFCFASRIDAVALIMLGFWLIATLSPLLGLLALWNEKFWNAYVSLAALTFFILWLSQFLVEMRVTYCDSL